MPGPQPSRLQYRLAQDRLNQGERRILRSFSGCDDRPAVPGPGAALRRPCGRSRHRRWPPPAPPSATGTAGAARRPAPTRDSAATGATSRSAIGQSAAPCAGRRARPASSPASPASRAADRPGPRRIVDDVARDIGELEGDAEIAGAIERVAVAGIDAHDHRHHAADRAGDMIAIRAGRPRFGGRQPSASSAKPSRWSSMKRRGIAAFRARPCRARRTASRRSSRRPAPRRSARAIRRCAAAGSAGACASWPSVWPSARSSQARHQA